MKQIIFTYEGKDYTLEYTRRTVQQMEAEGFVTEDVQRKPMTLLPALFAGAFKAHHRFVKQEMIDKIYISVLADYIPYMKELVDEYRLNKVADVIPGGETAQDSIYNALKKAESENVPFTNYGILIAYMNGILKRCVKPLGIEI